MDTARRPDLAEALLAGFFMRMVRSVTRGVHTTGALRKGSVLLTLAAVSIVLLILAACGSGEEAPAGSSAAKAIDQAQDASQASASDSTPTGGESTEQVATATRFDQTQGASEVSLDDYLAICGGQAEATEWEEGVALRDLSSGLGQHIEILEALGPPLEVSDWHAATLAFGRAFKKTIDDYLEDPKGSV